MDPARHHRMDTGSSRRRYSGSNNNNNNNNNDNDNNDNNNNNHSDSDARRGSRKRRERSSSSEAHRSRTPRRLPERDGERYGQDRKHRKSARHRDASEEHSRHRSPDERKRYGDGSQHHRRRSRSPGAASRPRRPSEHGSFRAGLARGEAPAEKQKPNFKPTGLLAKEANTVAGTTTVLQYHEPPEARKPPPTERWRMYVFEGADLVDTVHLHTRSAWLVGRDDTVADLVLRHPSISKQHAVLQFRHRTTTTPSGDRSSRVTPYLIDLDSAHGSALNGIAVARRRYLELIDGDVLSFGRSPREYVMMLPRAEREV